MKRPARLQSARAWVQQFGPGPHGRRLVHAYSVWYHTGLGCALKELQTLEVVLDPDYIQKLQTTIRETSRGTGRKKTPEPEVPAGYGQWWDDNFAYIDGYTEGGFPCGTTWEESSNPEAFLEESPDSDSSSLDPDSIEDDEIPF